jgi:hypothetical protein
MSRRTCTFENSYLNHPYTVRKLNSQEKDWSRLGIPTRCPSHLLPIFLRKQTEIALKVLSYHTKVFPNKDQANMDERSGYASDAMRANRIGHAASPTPVDTLSVALIDSASCSGRNPRTGESSALLAAISETVAREREGEAILFPLHC